MSTKKSALGRGLSALLEGNNASTEQESAVIGQPITENTTNKPSPGRSFINSIESN
jgi:hypothetical protein